MLHVQPNLLLSDTYYLLTTNIAANQLKLKLRAAGGDIKKEAIVWDKWIENWSQFSLSSFLHNTRNGVIELLDTEHQLSDVESNKLDKLLPWPEEAVKAYTVFSYTTQLDISLVIFLRDQVGVWWSPHMHRIDGGMSILTESFIEKRSLPHWKIGSIHLQEKITYNSTVNEIEYVVDDHDDPNTQTVTVKGYYTSSGQPFKVNGDAVIITIPLHLIRYIKFVAKKNTAIPEQLTEMYKAVEDIWQEFATKVMIQCSDRFWEKEGIRGGFSKTNLPIGQVHYPTYDENANSEKGILMCYTWKSEAHVYPVLNMFFAGDGISFANGWIQGALESGLQAAYQFYNGNEEASNKCKA